jgi:energy-coupling factor transport system ATP-binding protein
MDSRPSEKDSRQMDVRIESLSFSYPSGVEALHQVSLTIESGVSLALIGQNGAGKTTLVKHLNGLLRPTRGEVWVGDWDTRQHTVAALSSRVGYVFQNPDDQLFQSKVRAEVMFGPQNLKWPADRITQQTQIALEMVKLTNAAERHPYDLSAGERKRVALAAVLAMDTPVVVLDEPTTGQDYAGVNLIGEIVEWLKGQGKTVITITHDIDFCAEHFERVLVMAGGQVLLDGPGREVLAETKTLASSDVEPPQITRLATGLGMRGSPLTVDEFVSDLAHGGVGVEAATGKPSETAAV